MKRTSYRYFWLLLAAALLGAHGAHAADTAQLLPPTPGIGASLFRMLGALCVVLALFFAGAWLFRNWSRLNASRGGARKLNVLDAKSVGARQSIFVVGYEERRFLIGSTPQGLVLLSHLPDGKEVVEFPEPSAAPLPFAQALMQALGRK
jgi:flagellar biogenesis protein FliO